MAISKQLARARPGHVPTGPERLGSTRRPGFTAGGRRALIGMVLGPVLLVGMLAAPINLTQDQHALGAVLGFTMVYWITEALPIPVTSILALALCVVLNVGPAHGQTSPAEIVFSDFSSPTLFLLIGGFVMAQAMIKHDLHRRLALWVLSLPGVAHSTYRVVFAMGSLAALLSSVIADGAVATMLLPVALGLNKELSERIRAQSPELAAKQRLRFSAALMLMTAYATTVGGLLTPIGDPANLIGRAFIDRELGLHISFVKWFLLAAPIVVVLFGVLCGVLLLFNRPETREIIGGRRLVRYQRAELGPMSRGEINTAFAFGTAVSLWLLPTIGGFIAGSDSPLHDFLSFRLDPAVGAIIGAALLFVLPVDWQRREFTLTWPDATKIDWGTVLLVGTGLTFGRLMVSTGLAALIGHSLAGTFSGVGATFVYVLAAVIAILISETTSNTASVGIVVPTIPALVAAGGGDGVTAAMIATFAATYGFMLPISSSANAIVYSSGRIPITRMVISGAVIDLSGILIIVVGVNLMLGIVGLPGHT
jgi:sodium-dependent dicarboxylate transporter 2/3/5